MAQTRGMSASVFLYFAGERLSEAELSAARLDGHLVDLGEGYMPADAVETAAMRAASLGSLLADAMAASLLSAAWIWGAIDEPPTRHSAHRAVERRLHHVIDRRLVLHDVAVPAAGRVRIGGIWVTTPLQTLLDLARAWVDAPSGDAMLHALRAIVARGLANPLEAIEQLSARSRMPGKKAVITALDSLASRK